MLTDSNNSQSELLFFLFPNSTKLMFKELLWGCVCSLLNCIPLSQCWLTFLLIFSFPLYLSSSSVPSSLLSCFLPVPFSFPITALHLKKIVSKFTLVLSPHISCSGHFHTHSLFCWSSRVLDSGLANDMVHKCPYCTLVI